jgi:hypothetical protein
MIVYRRVTDEEQGHGTLPEDISVVESELATDWWWAAGWEGIFIWLKKMKSRKIEK